MPTESRRWRLPTREHWLLLVGVAALLFFAFGFVELTFTRQRLLARYEQAITKRERLTEQNARLQQELTRQQQGEHLPDRAFQYFGQAPRGAGVVIVEPEPTGATQMPREATTTQEPVWTALWKRLIRALTNLRF